MTKMITLIISFLCMCGLAAAQKNPQLPLDYAQRAPIAYHNVKTPFNADKIIQQVSRRPVRESGKIATTNQPYKTPFDEQGMSGEQEFDSDIACDGTGRGLPFVVNSPLAGENPNEPYAGTRAANYSGNRAGPKSGEFLIDTNVVYVPAINNQCVVSTSFDGTNYLVVWADGRSGTSWDIYGARVNPDGALLDTSGIAISTNANCQYWPAVAFDGTNYLVVWGDSLSGSNFNIYGARVSQAGAVLDPAGIAICTAANSQYQPSVEFGGANYLVVWYDRRSGSYFDIYGARVDPSGAVLDASGIAISTAANGQYSPVVAFDGTNYLVVWHDYRKGNTYDSCDVYGARVNQSGAVLDPAGIAISTANMLQASAAVVFDGANYLAVWHDFRNGSSNADIYCTRIDTAGAVLDAAGIAVSNAVNNQAAPAVSFDGTNCLVAWYDYRNGSYADIYCARIDLSGAVLDASGIAISTAANHQWSPAIAFDGENYLVVWDDYRGPTWDVWGARVNQPGAVLDAAGICISATANDQRSPAAAFDGTNYLLVWQDFRAGSVYDIYGARVSQSGVILDPAGIAISTATNNQSFPSVAFDGTNYLVAWTDARSGSSDIYGARVSQTGAVLDPAGVAISAAANYQYSPVAAFDGTNYLVVWYDYRNGTGYTDIYGARVSPAGAVLDAGGIAVSTETNHQWDPAVAFDGANYFVAWTDLRSGSGYTDIYGARVDTSGAVLDASGIAISSAANNQWEPAVAFDGTNYLSMWTDTRNGAYSDIYGARISPAGAVLDVAGIAISTSTYNQSTPAAAFTGTEYMAVWQDDRSGSSDIYGARVDTAGSVLDAAGIAFAAQSGGQNLPVLAHGTGDQLIVAYSGWTDYINSHYTKTYRIWGTLYSATGVEGKPELPITNYEIRLGQNTPNPFARTTAISFQLPQPANVRLKVYNISGQLVKTLASEFKPAGHHSVKWDGRDANGQKVAAGVYLYRMEAGDYSKTNKLTVLR